MAENLDININVKTQGADQPIKSIREQIKQATKDVVEFSSKFGATSKEAIEAAKKVSELRDRIGDAKSLSDAFNPDAKFKALTASLSGVAGGFGAVQGAMALFGAESDNVQKTLLKVQSAMAVSQGLQSVGESIDSFKQLGAVIQSTSVYQAAYNFIMGDAVEVAQEAVVSIQAETVALEAEAAATVEVATATTGATIAMRIFRAALIATGIGAIVLLFGLLVEQLQLFTSDTKKAKEAQDELNKSLSALSENLNLEVKALERVNKYRVAQLKAQGATEAEIFKENRETQKKILEAYEEDYKVRYEKYQKQLTEIKKIEDKEQKKAAEDSAEELRKQLISDSERNKDLRIQIRIDKLSFIKSENDEELAEAERLANDKLNLDLKYLDKLKEQRKKLNKETIGQDGMTDSERKKKVEDDEKDKADREKRNREFNEESEKNGLGKVLAIKAKADLDSIKQDEDTAAAKKRISELEKESKEATAYAIADITAGISNIIGQETAVGKGIAIASATIDTYLGASRIFKQASDNPITVINPAYPYLMAAPAVLSGIARVKQIAAVSIPKGGGGGGSNIPSMSNTAPMMPQLPKAQITQLNQQSINDIGNQAVRAYVVESDVTSSQERITAIRQRARFS